MNPDDIARILDDLGQRIGPAGEYVFALAVRQALIDGAAAILAAILFGGVAFALWRLARGQRRAAWDKWSKVTGIDKGYPSISGHPNEDLGIALPSVGLHLGMVVAAIVSLAAFQTAMSYLLNPEYAALTDILSRIVR